jgi:hypothetical protein
MARQKEEILFEWVESKAVAIQSARSLNQYGITAFSRGFAIITVLLAVLYFVFDYLFPPDLPLPFNLSNVFLKLWCFGIGILVFCYFLGPWIFRDRYRITTGRIRIASGDHSRIFKWQDLTGYILSESKTIPGQRDITLLTDGRTRIIHLPNNNLAEQIIQYVAGRLPVSQSIPASAYPTPLTFLQKCCFVFCTILYSGAAAYWIVFSGAHIFQKYRYEYVWDLLVVLTLFFGPGTICSIGMFGWSFFKNKWFRFYAIIFNVLGFILLMLFSMILLLWKLRRDAGGW